MIDVCGALTSDQGRGSADQRGLPATPHHAWHCYTLKRYQMIGGGVIHSLAS